MAPPYKSNGSAASSAIERLLARLPKGDLEIQALFESIYQTRFTGPIAFDILKGVPRQINLGQPVKQVICHATDPAPADPAIPPAVPPLKK
jgi:hypothetical protein